MMTDSPINNASISEFADSILANDDQYQVDVPMAGRRAQFQHFISIIREGGPAIVTISAPLGSGKTFFLRKAFGHLMREDRFPEGTNKRIIYGNRGQKAHNASTAAHLGGLFAASDPDYPSVLIVEELDRKAAYKDLTWVIEEAVTWLGRETSGVVVLSGDRFLEHPTVGELTRRANVPILPIMLEPLDRGLMIEALALRFAAKILDDRDPEAGRSRAQPAAEAVLAERPVETSVLPPSEPAVANFREAFGLLQRLVNNARLDLDQVRLEGELIQTVARDPRLLPLQRPVDQFVLDRVSAALREGEKVREMSLDELRSAMTPRLHEEDFRRSVAEPLVRAQVVLPQGIPYLANGQVTPDAPFVEPFLPKQDTFLRAWASVGV